MRYQINLFPPREESIVDKIIYFSFHYLRYILVITQLVVIGVFFYRFKIDQEIVDLKDSLKQKEEIVLVSNSLLREVRAIDVKEKNVDKILDNQQTLEAMLDYFLSRFPADLNLVKMELSADQLKFEGFTRNPAIVRTFNDRLNQEKRFKLVKLEALRKGELGFTFAFTLSQFVLTK